jgi:predicted NBD/HSP70 family sugar kinase
MRIFERLRGRSRSDSAIERKLFEAITDDLLQKLEDETSVPVLTESKANCCSCCSAEEEASH